MSKKKVKSKRGFVEGLKRSCGECSACERDPECGWKQGLLGPLHRPDRWGMILEGKRLDNGKAVFVFREILGDVRHASDVKQVISATALHQPVIVATNDGKPVNIIGPEGVVDDVVSALGISAIKADMELHEMELDHVPVNPLDGKPATAPDPASRIIH